MRTQESSLKFALFLSSAISNADVDFYACFGEFENVVFNALTNDSANPYRLREVLF